MTTNVGLSMTAHVGPMTSNVLPNLQNIAPQKIRIGSTQCDDIANSGKAEKCRLSRNSAKRKRKSGTYEKIGHKFEVLGAHS